MLPDNRKPLRRFRILTRIIVWGVGLILVVWALNKEFVPTGIFRVIYRIPRGTPEIAKFAEKEPYPLIGTVNGTNGKEFFQAITKDPLYFQVNVPRPFQKATVKIFYQNPDQQPDLKLGVQKANGTYAFAPLALTNDALTKLPEEWLRMQDGDLVLWQKNNELLRLQKERNELRQKEQAQLEQQRREAVKKANQQADIHAETDIQRRRTVAKIELRFDQAIADLQQKYSLKTIPKLPYSSVSQFIQHPPSTEVTLLYNYSLGEHVQLSGYVPFTKPLILEKSLRGPHELVAYIGEGEKLRFEFVFQNINRHEGEDLTTIQLIGPEREVLDQKRFELGDFFASGEPSEEKTVVMEKTGLPCGIYHLKISTDDDVFIRRIKTQQHLLMFRKRLYIAENDEYRTLLGTKELLPTTLFFVGPEVAILTAHEKGLQTVQFGRQKIVLDTVHESKTVVGLKGVTRVNTPRNDIQLDSGGYFAFSEEQMFDVLEKYPEFSAESDLNRYDFIFAKLHPPQQEGQWLVAEATFQMPELHTKKDGTVHFLVRMPGLSENHRTINVREIRIEMRKPALTLQRLFEKIKNRLTR